jgi:thiamine-monophosphate kinase
LAISTDTLVAGVHFADPCDPFLLGQRSLAVAVSDLAAMGATPIAFTLALTLPTVMPTGCNAMPGFERMAQSCGVSLVGGDTTRGPLSLTMTVFGRVPAGQALTRSGARPGDLLCVGGELGNAAGACRWYWGSALPTRPSPIRCWPITGRRSRNWPWAWRFVARPLRRWISPTGLLADCGHIAKASASAC